MHVKKIQFCLLVCCFLCCIPTCILAVSESRPGEIVTNLPHGCKMIRQNKSASVDPMRSWFDMPLPLLNCSSTGQNTLDVEGVVADARGIYVSHNDIIQFNVDDLEQYSNLTKLSITSNNLQRVLPSQKNTVFSFTSSVSFTSNKLTEVPTEALKSFPSLIFIFLGKNKISTLKNDDFQFNKQLKFIDLSFNPLLKLNDAWISLLNPSSLNLRGCNLTEVPGRLANATELVYVDLADNQITNLKENAFVNCSFLYWLELASNKIKTVAENAFKGTKNLITVDLSDNLIETLSENTFDHLSKENLEVNLYENPINCNCSMRGFKNWIEQRKEQDVSTEIRFTCRNPARNHGKKSNQLVASDYSCLNGDTLWTDQSNCPQPVTSTTTIATTTTTTTTKAVQVSRTCPLKCTCFDENGNIYYPKSGQPENGYYKGWLHWGYRSKLLRVDCINTGYYGIPPKLPGDVQTLVISGNPIFVLEMSQLAKFTKLKGLFLKGNKIATITPSIRTVLPNLSVLDLADNRIKTINKTHMKTFPNVEVASLYHNQLTSIPQDLFAFNHKISRLYLGPNPVKTFKEDFMKTLSLRSLSLRNMSLTEIPKSLSKLENLRYADLSDNKITAIKNGTFSKCASLIRLALDNNRIANIEANAFNGATSLVSVKLSENLLTSLPSQVFSNLSSERLTVQLWDNRISCDCKMKEFKAWIEKKEDDDPMTEIRFLCDQPMRMHGKKSDQLTPNDFYCSDDDVAYRPPEESSVCPQPNNSGAIAVSVVVTFIVTAFLCVILWRCTFKKRYGELLTYAKQRNQFDDMEELQ